MRKLYFLALILSVAILLNGCGKKEGAGDKKDEKTEQKTEKKDISFSEKSNYHIKYDIKGKKESGTMDLYFKDKNAKIEVKITEGEKKSNVAMYYENKVAYVITEIGDKKMGMKMAIDSKDKDDFMELFEIKDKLKEYEKTGTDEVLGYKCDVYKTKDGTLLSMYKDVFTLKMVGKDNEEFVATALEQDVKIGDDFFTPPKDVEYMDFSKLGNLK